MQVIRVGTKRLKINGFRKGFSDVHSIKTGANFVDNKDIKSLSVVAIL